MPQDCIVAHGLKSPPLCQNFPPASMTCVQAHHRTHRLLGKGSPPQVVRGFTIGQQHSLLESPSFSEGERHLPGTSPFAPVWLRVSVKRVTSSPQVSLSSYCSHAWGPSLSAGSLQVHYQSHSLGLDLHLSSPVICFYFLLLYGSGVTGVNPSKWSKSSVLEQGHCWQCGGRSESLEGWGGASDGRDPGATEGPSQGRWSWRAATRATSPTPCHHPAAGCPLPLGQLTSSLCGGQGPVVAQAT